VRIPRFWAAVDGSGAGPQGEQLFRRVWGWSMSSAAEALAVAQERLRAALANRLGVRVGGYYPRTPLREPILDELIIDGEQAFVITRNRYGAEVLNTDRVLIADIDLPALADTNAAGLFRRLFRRETPAPADPLAQPPLVVERLATLADWAGANPDLGVITYRTASGLRVFVTGIDEPVSSARGAQVLAELGADPIYRELCRSHGTFRARLTPKPWRLPRMSAPRGTWPFEDGQAERHFQDWLANYDAVARGFAVCRRLATHGPAPSALEAQIIGVHDDRTRILTTLPLA
jgi:hypothetical protein